MKTLTSSEKSALVQAVNILITKGETDLATDISKVIDRLDRW